MTIAHGLRRWRRQRGLSQRELAERSGVGPAVIARVELGRVDPRLGTLARLAAALRVRVTDLLAERPSRRRPGQGKARG